MPIRTGGRVRRIESHRQAPPTFPDQTFIQLRGSQARIEGLTASRRESGPSACCLAPVTLRTVARIVGSFDRLESKPTARVQAKDSRWARKSRPGAAFKFEKNRAREERAS